MDTIGVEFIGWIKVEVKAHGEHEVVRGDRSQLKILTDPELRSVHPCPDDLTRKYRRDREVAITRYSTCLSDPSDSLVEEIATPEFAQAFLTNIGVVLQLVDLVPNSETQDVIIS